jgi:hypothetical protein
MLDAVTGENQQRPLRAQFELCQPSGERADSAQGLRIADALPRTAGCAARNESGLRSPRGPVFERIGDAVREWRQRGLRSKQQAAIDAAFQAHFEWVGRPVQRSRPHR